MPLEINHKFFSLETMSDSDQDICDIEEDFNKMDFETFSKKYLSFLDEEDNVVDLTEDSEIDDATRGYKRKREWSWEDDGYENIRMIKKDDNVNSK